MKKFRVPVLGLMLASMTVSLVNGFAQSEALSLDESTLMNGAAHLPGGSQKVSVSAVNENIRTVLHDLSRQGRFNLIMDPSVTGTITLELDKVTLDQALESVAALNDLLILKQSGGIYLAITRQASKDKGLSRQLSKVIPINYSNANRIANILNTSLFASANATSGSGGSSASGSAQKVKADSQTNSIIVIGTARELELAESAISRLDLPRQSKTFYLSHANALDMATLLSSSVFNDGTASINVSGSSSSSGSSGGTGNEVTASTMRVEKQNLLEGSGVNNFGGGSSGGGSSAGLSSAVTLRGFVKTTDSLSVSPEGVLIIPDTRQNTVTIMGTAEQIAMAESMIPTLDAQLPQVSIEASLIEVSSTGVKELSNRLGIADGRLQTGFNNAPVGGVSAGVPGGVIGLPTVDPTDNNSFGRTGLVFSSNPLNKNPDYVLQLRRLISQSKAKILANPTVVATHDTESIISIVDEIVRRVTTTVSEGFVTQQIEIGEAGIVMDILPKIGEDGTISMRLRPSVSSILSQTRDAQGNIITLLSKRDLFTQSVRMHNGETLVIGGLIQDQQNSRIDKLPFGGDLPIVGAMFRSQSNGTANNPNKRSELVMLITPHIINKTQTTPVNTSTSGVTSQQTSMAGGQ